MSQSHQIPIWLRQMNGWQDTPPWLLELIARVEEGPGFEEGEEGQELEGLEALSSALGFDTGQLSATPTAEAEDWLSKLEAEMPAEEEAPAEPGPVPDWLAGLEGETPPAAESAAAAELWEFEGEGPPSEAAPGEEEAVPDWMAGFESRLAAEQEREAGEDQGADDLAAPGPGPVDEAVQEPEPDADRAPESNLPSWLSGLETEAPDWLAQARAGEPATQEGLPDWLAEFEQRAAAPPAPEEPGVEAGEGAAAPDRLIEGATEGAEPAEESAPDWLTRLQPEEPGPEAGAGQALPDWLAEVAAEGRGPAQEAAAEGEEPAEEAPAEEAPPDWLARLEPEAEGEGAPVPDWLAEIAAAAPEQETGAETAPPEGVEIPDWLAQIESVSEPDTSESELGVPDWLAQMTAGLPAAEAAPDQAPEAEPEEGIPPWLAGMETGRLEGEEAVRDETEAQAETAPPAQPEEEEGVPGWLQDMGEVSPAAESPTPRGVTDWLHGIQEMPVPAQPVAEEPEGEPALPEWLQNLEPAAPAEGAEETAAPDEPVEIPDWLREAPEEEAEEPEIALSAQDQGQEPEIELPATPSWMQEMAAAPEEPASLDEMLSLPDREITDVPEWVHDLRPEEAEAPAPAAEGREETSGPLAGLRGILDPEPLLAIFPKSAYRPVPRVPEEQLRQVPVIDRLLSQPSVRPVPTARATGRLVLSSLGRWAMYLVILAVLLIAPLRTAIRPPDTLSTQSFVNTVDGLASDSEVLLVVDYDPSLDGEMTPLARAVIWHLVQKNVGIVAVSLTPEGPAMVQALFDEYSPLLAGVYYVNLGYLPAHPASLQAFALDPLGGAAFPAPEVDLRQVPLGQRIAALGDMDLVVLLSGDPGRVRWWIEQIGLLGPADIVAGVSAAALPYVLPYYSADGRGQLRGLLAGLPGTARYENLIGADFAPSSRENWIVTANLQLLLAAFLVAGAVASAIQGRRKAS